VGVTGPELPLAIAAGAVCGAGVLLFVLAAVLGIPRRRVEDGGAPRPRRTTRSRRLAAAGAATAVLTLVVTRWVVLAVTLGVLVALWDRFVGGAAEERRALARLEALASWTESLRDTIAGAVGLEQAIPATAATAAPQIRPALNLLVDRLRIREPLPLALRRLADDLDDASADLIVAALVLNARLRGPGLREVLTALAASAREELDMRRRIEAERRSTRRSVQIVVAITVGVAAMLTLLNQAYVAPYRSFVGQVVLTVVIVLFGTGVAWLRRLARVETPERFLLVRTADTPGALSGDLR
jgi:Flp pilus assembly protein TadB